MMGDLVFDGVEVAVGSGRSRQLLVRGVDLRVGAGEVVGLVGESGSGKSTLAKAAVGLMPTSAGRVLHDGAPLPDERSRERRRVQMVFQDPQSCLNPRRTIAASLAEAVTAGTGRRAPRGSAPAVAEEVRRLLGLVGLPERIGDRMPRELSGGQRQRIAVARALGARPDMILADEITSALDVSVQGAVLNLLRDLQQQLGFGMLFISHNLAVVRLLSDRVAVMSAGVIVEQGATEDLLRSPKAEYTRRLLASVPAW